MVRNDLRRRSACSLAAVAGFHDREVRVERGVDLLLVSGVRLLHDCCSLSWEFNID